MSQLGSISEVGACSREVWLFPPRADIVSFAKLVRKMAIPDEGTETKLICISSPGQHVAQPRANQPMGFPMARRTVIADRWFVSVEAPKQWRLKSSASTRQTRTFPTEREARQFAKAMLSEGMKIMAGTLQPHQPRRRVIGPLEINQWIEEEEKDDPA
jgi:hypothetical protein